MEKISIIGLGYVGLPLALEFSKFFKVIGYDLDLKRINDLNNGIDNTKECSSSFLKNSLKKNLVITNKKVLLEDTDYFIITVPTPIFKNKKPNLSFIKNATKLVASKLNKGRFVIYESTVYPGLIEEICIPLIEKKTKLKLNDDFFCGYSPERINPGDKIHNLTSIVKIVSASNKYSLNKIDSIYKKIIKAGTFRASSIKVAEAAKVIENTQRDINIGFMNELSIIFKKMDINIFDVLSAANTKWNFLNFKPGLVGGHCIGVDPYYLTYKSKKIGINPKIILSGRKLNDSIGSKISNTLIKDIKKLNIKKKPNILIMGLTFKENCPDIRNSKVFEIIDALLKKNVNLNLYDNNVDKQLLNLKYKKLIINTPKFNFYDLIFIAVAHNDFKKLGYLKIIKFGKKNVKIYDFKNLFKNANFFKF